MLRKKKKTVFFLAVLQYVLASFCSLSQYSQALLFSKSPSVGGGGEEGGGGVYRAD